MSFLDIVMAAIATVSALVVAVLLWIWIEAKRADRRAVEQAEADDRTVSIVTGLRRGDPEIRNHGSRYGWYEPEILHRGNPHRR